MKILGQIILVVGSVVLAYLLYAFWPELRHATRMGEPQRITAEVQLINRCGMPDPRKPAHDRSLHRRQPCSSQ